MTGWTCRLTAVALGAVMTTSLQPLHAQDVLGAGGITGAGSTFIYPLLSRWSQEYRQWRARGGDFPAANAGLDDPPAYTALAYEPVGSLGGMLRLKDRAVDFAVSDMPVEPRELATLGLRQFPIVLGGVAVAVNVADVGPGGIRFTGDVLADIFLGRIDRWSHPAVKALNPTLNLPAAPITVVHRADGSGTTFNFANYLSGVSPEWKNRVGAAMLLPWPTGTSAKGNDGVAQTVKRTPNSIGYVDFAEVRQTGLGYAAIKNRAGQFITPNPGTFLAAAAGASWRAASDFHVLLTDAPGEQAYPITATVFVFLHKSAARAKVRAALDFFQWSLERGAQTARTLGYEPLPAFLTAQVKDYWRRTSASQR